MYRTAKDPEKDECTTVHMTKSVCWSFSTENNLRSNEQLFTFLQSRQYNASKLRQSALCSPPKQPIARVNHKAIEATKLHISYSEICWRLKRQDRNNSHFSQSYGPPTPIRHSSVLGQCSPANVSNVIEGQLRSAFSMHLSISKTKLLHVAPTR